jgi:diguanylate cyclase (GGDEF)-like protein/PAS domain S-box-containing protein
MDEEFWNVPQARVLIVEDDGIIARHVQSILKKNGYTVTGAVASGSLAVEQAKELAPDLVLMDISLQGEIDGISAAGQIQTNLDIPIIYLTAYADVATLQKAKITDPFGYILKPFDERTLLTTIEMALNKHTLLRQLRESEDLFRTLVENQGEGMVIMDANHLIVFANPALERIAGVKSGGLIGRSFEDFVSPTNWQVIVTNSIDQAKKDKRIYEIEIDQADGPPRNLRITGTPRIKNGVFAGTFGLVQDITLQKQMEQAEHEQRLLAEAMRDTASALTSTLNLDEVLDRILANLGKVVPHDGVNIMLFQNGNLEIVRGRGLGSRISAGESGGKIALGEFNFFQSMLTNGQPVVIADLEPMHLEKFHPNMAWLKSYAGAPIRIRGELTGYLNLGSAKPCFFTQAHSERLQMFADQAGLAIENARLYQELQQRAHFLMVLNKVTQAAIHSADLESSLRMIATLIGELYKSDGIYITLWNEENRLTIPAAAYGYTAEEYRTIQYDPGDQTLTAAALDLGKPMVAEDVRNSPYISPELGATYPVHSMLGFPLIADEKKLGAILIGYRQAHHFTRDEISRGEEFAAQVALAISKLRLYAEFQKLSVTDELTGLYNRRGIFELGREQVSIALRNHSPLAMIWLDIDHFKQINDEYGHPAGDEVICVVAERCRNSVKGRDLIGRYGGEGGDELIILLLDTDLAGAQNVAERVRVRIQNDPIITNRGDIAVTVSLGITTLQSRQENLSTLLNRADKAMYAAKAAGRNCCFVDAPCDFAVGEIENNDAGQ